MKKYIVPEIEFVAISAADILLESDTLINIGSLYGEPTSDAQLVSEYTGEPYEG